MFSPMLSLLILCAIFLPAFSLVKRECSPESRNSQEDCPTDANYVCAYFSGGTCGSELCEKQAVNDCFACKDPSVQYFVNGACESDKIYCENSSRDLISNLYEYVDLGHTVCGYYTTGCLEGECSSGTSSQYSVCSDPTIVFYRPGYCTIDDKVSDCPDPGYCNPLSYSSAVCLFKEDCQGADCAETFSDACQGCYQYPNSTIKNGPCVKDRIVCQPNLACENVDSGPVCAFFIVSDPTYYDDYYYRQATVGNACAACKDNTVDFYTLGSCQQSEAEYRQFCLPSHNPIECGGGFEIVCGYNNEDLAVSEFPSGCSACLNENITYYTSGICLYQCPTAQALSSGVVDCNGSWVDPVCFYIQDWEDFSNNEENEEMSIRQDFHIEEINSVRYKTVTVKNSCVGCYDLNFVFETGFFTKGQCYYDQGIYCSNEAASAYYGTISPVCGIFTEGCFDSSCRTTFAEPYAACNISSAILYVPGYCPGDQGISCNLYRSLFDSICEGMETHSVPVCGYTSMNCGDSSCRKTYNNQCYACSDSSVQFFANGACAEES